MKRQSLTLTLLTALTAVCVSLTATALQADRRSDSSFLVVGTYNAEFLWDGRAPHEGRIDFAWKDDPAAADAHMADIAAIITKNNPDILNMVEVESLAALQYFNKTYLQGMGYKAYLIKGRDSYTGQDVGLLTRIDPDAGRVERDDRKGAYGTYTKSVSKNQFARFTINGEKIALIGVHYVAFPTRADRVEQRMAQMDATRRQVSELQTAGYQTIVTGDLNDYDGVNLDVQGNTPTTSVVQSLMVMGPAANDNHQNALTLVPQETRYTSHWDKDRDGTIDGIKELSAIDHMLLSQTLYSRVHSVWIDQSFNPVTVSDHFPVFVAIDLNK